MAKLDNYIERKAAALADRKQDWTANPEKAIATIKASSRVAGITGARPTMMGTHTMLSDSAPGLAGHALGPTAPEMLLGALASCLVHTYLIQATIMQIPLDDVSVEISSTMDYRPVIGMLDTGASLMNDIRYTAHIESPADAASVEQLHHAVEASCPVLNTMRNPTSIRRVI